MVAHSVRLGEYCCSPEMNVKYIKAALQILILQTVAIVSVQFIHDRASREQTVLTCAVVETETENFICSNGLHPM